MWCQSMLRATKDFIKCSLPAHTCRYHAEWLVADLVLLVEHEKVRRSPIGFQSFLSMFDGPLELLGGDQDFTKDGIHTSLATIQACSSNDGILIAQQKSTTSVHALHRPCLGHTYFNRLFRTCLRSPNDDFAHSCCALVAFVTTRSIPSAVTGFTRPNDRPVAGL